MKAKTILSHVKRQSEKQFRVSANLGFEFLGMKSVVCLLCSAFLIACFILPAYPAVAAKPPAPHVVFVIAEKEYKTRKTLPAFAKKELQKSLGFRCTFLQAALGKRNEIPGLEALEEADLMVLSVRRRALPEEQLKQIRQYVEAGNPVVGIRTASHAFDTRGKHPEGHAEWRKFDPEVLGGNYHGHHSGSKETTAQVIAKVAEHPILTGITKEPFEVGGSLYKVRPLVDSCTPLMKAWVEGAEAEPVVWTNGHKGGRVFYTSLGHPEDFEIPAFRKLLLNGILWALDRPIPGTQNEQKTTSIFSPPQVGTQE